MRYRFKDRESGQIAEGYTVLQIIDFECEVSNDDTEAILLAEKSGGELLTQAGKPPKHPEVYRANLVQEAEETKDLFTQGGTK